MYREIEGNLLDLFDQGEFDMIGHGTNCQSIMGAGIALQIKERYSDAYYGDLYCSLSPVDKIGNYSSNIEGTIFNFYTQFEPGCNADYLWLKSSLRKFAYQYKGGFKIGLPKIGCGIGGLKWEIVKAIIKKELNTFDVTIVHYKNPQYEPKTE